MRKDLSRIDPCHGCQIPELPFFDFDPGGCGECMWQHYPTQKARITAWFAVCRYSLRRSSWAPKGVMRRHLRAFVKEGKRRTRAEHKRGARCFVRLRPGARVRAEIRRQEDAAMSAKE